MNLIKFIISRKTFISMLFIGLTDIHGKPGNIDKIADKLSEADAVVVSGDITHFGRENDAARIIESIKKIKLGL